MAKAKYLTDGCSVKHTPGSDVSAGDVIVLDDELVAIARLDIEANEQGDVWLDGHYEVEKVTGAISKGDRAYWDADGDPVDGDAGSGAFTADATKGPFAGWFSAAAASGDATAELVLASHPNVSLSRSMTAAVAATGSAQGDAAALTEDALNTVSAADGTKGVILPTAAAGKRCRVYNEHASNGLKVYPATGDDINDGSANAAITIEGKTLAVFEAIDGDTWAAIFTANT